MVCGVPDGDDGAAFFPCAGADIDDPVSGGDDVEVVLNDDDGVAAFDEAIELGEETFDVGGMQAGGGLVKDIEGIAFLRALELGGELDALGFASAELGGGLAQAEIAEADFAEDGERALDGGFVGEEVAWRRRR